MNERIKQLNLQAMSIVMNGNDPDGDIEQMYIPSEFTKKFALLIVQKCADIGQQYADGNYEVYNQILEHFGIEEE